MAGGFWIDVTLMYCNINHVINELKQVLAHQQFLERYHILTLSYIVINHLHFQELTPSSLPCSKWKAPALCMPGRNHTGCVLMSRSSSPMSHGGCSSDPDPEEPTEEQSPRAPSPSDDKLSRL